MQDYMSLRLVVMICATVVNTHTHTHGHTDSSFLTGNPIARWANWKRWAKNRQAVRRWVKYKIPGDTMQVCTGCWHIEERFRCLSCWCRFPLWPRFHPEVCCRLEMSSLTYGSRQTGLNSYNYESKSPKFGSDFRPTVVFERSSIGNEQQMWNRNLLSNDDGLVSSQM